MASLYKSSRSACRAISFNSMPTVAPSRSIDTRRRSVTALLASTRRSDCGNTARNRGRDASCIAWPDAGAAMANKARSVSSERGNERGRITVLRVRRLAGAVPVERHDAAVALEAETKRLSDEVEHLGRRLILEG